MATLEITHESALGGYLKRSRWNKIKRCVFEIKIIIHHSATSSRILTASSFPCTEAHNARSLILALLIMYLPSKMPVRKREILAATTDCIFDMSVCTETSLLTWRLIWSPDMHGSHRYYLSGHEDDFGITARHQPCNVRIRDRWRQGDDVAARDNGDCISDVVRLHRTMEPRKQERRPKKAGRRCCRLRPYYSWDILPTLQ